MSSTVKINPSDKEILEKLQAKLRIDANLKIDQYRLLGYLIKFGKTNYSNLLSFIEGVKLTVPEIEDLKSRFVKNYSHKYPDKTDDELIYGE